ncbi:ankyrin repeat domain-containing protein [bacterium]|nr:ankyrin repeat domain-containing protein [bacterium]
MSFKSKTVVGPRRKNHLPVGNKAMGCGRVTEKNNRLLRIADKKSANKDSKETKVIDGFIAAARIGDFNLVSRFIANGINVNVKDPYSRSAIYFAASNGHEDVVKLLLDYGADIKLKDTINEWTPLHVAAASQTPQVVELLILSGADLRARDKGGRTPYHLSFLDHQTNTSRLISKYRSKTKVS